MTPASPDAAEEARYLAWLGAFFGAPPAEPDSPRAPAVSRGPSAAATPQPPRRVPSFARKETDA